MLEIHRGTGSLELRYEGMTLVRFSGRAGAMPSGALRLGEARLGFKLFKGRFRVRDRTRFVACDLASVEEEGPSRCVLALSPRGGRLPALRLVAAEADGLCSLSFKCERPDLAIELELPASPDERVYGCGEHFTRLDLRGELVRLWVEEHIGTLEAIRKVALLALGLRPRTRSFRHYATYYPQPSFVSSQGYFFHAECWAYGTLDFRRRDRHVARFYRLPERILVGRRGGYADNVGALSLALGRQPPLPAWAYRGMILGAQGGTEACDTRLKRLQAAGAAISGLWAQDWEGERMTSFGKQLRWDYRWDASLYPGLPDKIREWGDRGVAFLGYVNPYLCEDGRLFAEARAKGFLALDAKGGPYLTRATSFPFGIVDLTDPAAYEWLKGIVKEHLIGLGMLGWMADFGEYLPADAVLAGGAGELLHNRWPVLWARLNREAVEESGLEGKAMFFARSGYAGSSRYATLVWNGDQHVDWSEDYGLGSVVRACLSLAMSGVGLCHADAGGYTTLPGIKRSKELLLRWLELSAFMPVMRSHEGNRPWDNWQVDSDEETIAATARLSRLHAALAPYLEFAQREHAELGLPAMRPLFLHYAEDFGRDEDRAYLLGRDLAVYPVLEPGASSRRLRLPHDRWLGLFSGRVYEGGELEVAAPLGFPPVFYRAESGFARLFAGIRAAI